MLMIHAVSPNLDQTKERNLKKEVMMKSNDADETGASYRT